MMKETNSGLPVPGPEPDKENGRGIAERVIDLADIKPPISDQIQGLLDIASQARIVLESAVKITKYQGRVSLADLNLLKEELVKNGYQVMMLSDLTKKALDWKRGL